MMEVNMNLTFPIADWAFGTSDLDRGLFGMCSTAIRRAISSAFARQPKGPEEAAAAPVGAN